MTTTSDLLDSTRRWLQSSGRSEHNRLTAQILGSATAATFDFPLGSITTGALLDVELEEIYVWTAAGAAATAIQRGWNGSVAATHAAGTLVRVNPLFSNWRILAEVNAELAALSSPATGLYRVKTVTKTATVASSYDLAADVGSVLAVQWNNYGPGLDWPRLRQWDLVSGQDTAVFPSGNALRLYEVPPPGRTIRVTYAASFGSLAALTDDVTVTGLPASANDIPAIGAAARLLSARESRRSQIDAAPEARQATDVPPGVARSAAQQLFALRDRRIREEAARLTVTWPSIRKSAV